jgi:light-regulated signal transduction histidine kinase (bacteriophytochrome)
MVDDFYKREVRYQTRMMREPWRRTGLHISAICRCEFAEPCFEHTVYLADLRSDAETAELEKRELQAETLFSAATEFYWRLTGRKK